ncbi:hypothetical protein PIB30_049755 [Stylosanthes scabra]|uniref:Uncharacterized protein n=1 Tax=Stylosanthes scabra TaxID=79078 RepID=A0ABU6WFU2_9FABA|nr:hypothetical protein [Stylosanthes scabra]
MNIYSEIDDRSVTVVKQRPPPEPPNLNLLEVGKKESASAEEMSCRPGKLMDTVTGFHNGAEDSAVAKGKVVDVGLVDLTRGSSSVVGVFKESMWTALGRTTASTVTGGAIFPWDQEEATQIERAANERPFEETHQKRLVLATDGDCADFRKGLGEDIDIIDMERVKFTRAMPEGERNLVAEQVMVTTEGGKRQRRRMGIGSLQQVMRSDGKSELLTLS